MEAREKNDIPIAHKALLLARDLSSADKAVAAAILDHFNRKTGQCDPSVGRLADLLSIDERTVKRATKALCGEHGLFEKTSHGGNAGRASYHPCWTKFREIVRAWDARMKSNSEPYKVTEMPPSTGQDCPLGGDKNAPQTYISNPSNKPISLPPAENPSTHDLKSDGLGGVVDGLLRKAEARSFDPHYLSREQAKVGSSHAQVAWSAANHRISAEIARMPPHLAQGVWAWLDERTLDAAITAEISRRGAGIVYIRDAMRGDMFSRQADAHPPIH